MKHLNVLYNAFRNFINPKHAKTSPDASTDACINGHLKVYFLFCSYTGEATRRKQTIQISKEFPQPRPFS